MFLVARFAAAAVALFACAIVVRAGTTPVGSAFTYQGELKLSGTPLNGTADFEFSLWDSASGPDQIGSTVPVNGVTVADGLFTVDLDFGTAAFGVNARWLEIAVRSPAGSGAFTTLTPRQRIQPTPLARFALSVDGGSITNLNASNVATGTLPSAALSGGTYSGPVTFNNPSNFFEGAFVGSGSNLNNLNMSNATAGTLPIARGGTGATTGPTALTSLNAQARVTGTAPVGSFIRSINADGTVVTAVDVDTNSGGDITGVTAGSGLAGGGTTGTVSLNIAAGGITNTMLASDAASLNKVSAGNMTSSGALIGVGTVTPSAKLHVSASSGSALFVEHSTASGWAVQANANGTNGRAIVGLAGSATANQMAIYGETNGSMGWAGYFQGRGHFSDSLGIGTSNPQAMLHVSTSTPVAMLVEHGAASGWAIQANANGTDGRAVVGLAGSATANQMAIYGETNGSSGWAGYFQGRGYFSDRVGIGTTNPFRKLDIVDTSFGALSFPLKIVNGGNTASTAVGMIFQVDDAADTRGKGAIAYERTNTWNRGSFHFLQNQSASSTVATLADSVMTITNTGSVGLGTTVPDRRLEVRDVQAMARLRSTSNITGSVLELANTTGGANDVGAVHFMNSAGTVMARIRGNLTSVNGLIFSTGGSDHMYINGGGDIAIGAPPTGLNNFEVAGSAAKPGGGSWAVLSDGRLKRNIDDLEGSLDRLLSLRGVSFEYIDQSHPLAAPGAQIGFIAQEVETVFPQWVNARDGGLKTVSISGFEALTVEALRELRAEKDAEISQLRRERDEKLAQQQRTIETLSERLARLERFIDDSSHRQTDQNRRSP